MNKFDYPEVETITTESGRIYKTPYGGFSSITTILSATKDMSGLRQWRERVGEEEADKILSASGIRGTAVHDNMERIVKGEPEKEEELQDKTTKGMFNALKQFSPNIDEVWGQEVCLYSTELEYAGRADLVGVWKDVWKKTSFPAIIDYKTSRKPKRREWIIDYFLQTLAYANAHNEMFGTNIQHGIILMTVENDMPQKFIVDFRKETELWDQFAERLIEYKLMNNKLQDETK